MADITRTLGHAANVALVAGVCLGAAAQPDGAHRISPDGIGGVRLGMTFDELRRALPQATITRTSDGDGAALVEVTLRPDESVVVWGDEDDPAAAIDWSKRVEVIETFSRTFHTDAGIHVGSSIDEVMHAYGAVTEIVKSEIESREFISFNSQPGWLTFRLNYTGIFADGTTRTTAYRPDASVWSIAVSRHR